MAKITLAVHSNLSGKALEDLLRDGQVELVFKQDGPVPGSVTRTENIRAWICPQPTGGQEGRATSPNLPSEALFAFMGWLTSREPVSGPFSSRHNAAQAADLVDAYCEFQGWEKPRVGWEDLIASGASSAMDHV